MNTLLVEFARFQNLFPHTAGLLLCLIKSSAIIMMAAAIRSLLKTRSARARNWVWWFALAGLFGLALWQVLPAGARTQVLAVRAVPASFPIAAAAPVSVEMGAVADLVREGRQRPPGTAAAMVEKTSRLFGLV